MTTTRPAQQTDRTDASTDIEARMPVTSPLEQTDSATVEAMESEPSTDPGDGLLRRTVLKAGAVTLGAVTLGAPVAAENWISDEDRARETLLDGPQGFGVEVLSTHASFPDDVAASFRMQYDGGTGALVSNLPRDASSVVVAKVTWQPAGTSGWHTHPGPVIVSIAEGAVEVVNDRDCVHRTYSAGEAFIDPGQGNVHVASNPSDSAIAVAYATFLGVPDGAPATAWVPAVDCF